MHMRAVALEGQERSGYEIPWSWSNRPLRIIVMQVLGTKPRSSARAAGALNHWAISPAPFVHL